MLNINESTKFHCESCGGIADGLYWFVPTLMQEQHERNDLYSMAGQNPAAVSARISCGCKQCCGPWMIPFEFLGYCNFSYSEDCNIVLDCIENGDDDIVFRAKCDTHSEELASFRELLERGYSFEGAKYLIYYVAFGYDL